MSEKSSQTNINSSKTIIATTTSLSDVSHRRHRIVQDYLLIWLDNEIDQFNKDCQNTLAQLRDVVNDVHIFTESDECVDFLTDIGDKKAFLIAAGTISLQIIPFIHNIPQLDAVYILWRNKSQHEQCANKWDKVKGVHTEITPICESLQHAVKQCNQNSIAVCFVPVSEETSGQNLDQLEPSFMYTQIFKEILLSIKYNTQSIKDFTTFCREGNYASPSSTKQFENEYHIKSPVWWYTSSPFIYPMLNSALRTLTADIIIKMGFFIHDLHQKIEELHQQQVSDYYGQPFVVYRGQGLSRTDFEKLLKAKGGLISFNNFLSTSKDPEISRGFAEIALTQTDDMVGILFKMSIDPSISSAPFAAIQQFSCFQKEEEILFSMHTVFRIDEITEIGNNSRLHQVDLVLTSDDDQQLRILTERIRVETVGPTGWERLGKLMLKIGQSNKAEELYEALLQQASDEYEKALYYNQLGHIKHDQGSYEKAVWYHNKSLEIDQRTLFPDHPYFATSYNNVGGVYFHMGEYSKAISFYEKALEIQQKTLPSNHPHLAASYNSIATAYSNMGECLKALSFYEKALEIFQKTLPPNHPDLATAYNNVGGVHFNMGEYSKAISFCEKALEMKQKILPSNHPDLATSYNNVGGVHYSMGEYSKALSCYEKALEIRQKTLPSNHPHLATSYNNIGLVYNNIGEYSKALSCYEKTCEIYQKVLSPNHPDLAITYNNIGLLYSNMGEYSKAVSFYGKAIEIQQKTLPSNHPHLVNSYANIGIAYYKMGEYSKAMLYGKHAFNPSTDEFWQRKFSQY
jgi:tetratricopeptide (TPR) repeat protein